MTVRIEPAVEADLERMVALLGLLFAQEAEFRPDPQAQARGLRLILADPGQGQLLVAREGRRVVGMVSLLWSTSTALGGPVAWLEDLVVDSGCRGRGVGKALLAGAVAFGKEVGMLRITLLTDGDNQRAQGLYAAQGFEASPMVPMRILF